jgi:hypothetical protein
VKLFDVAQEAHGVIAIGQIATGVVAIGQVATGVIAIGQGARGVIAIGQGAIGLVAVGMGAVGLFWAAGLGIGGRGVGGILKLVPALAPPMSVPKTTSWGAIEASGSGWMRVTVAQEEGDPVLRHRGGALPARIDAGLTHAARGAIGETLLARFRQGGICDRLMVVPVSRLKQPRWWGIWAAQVLGLIVLAAAVLGIAIWPAVQVTMEALGL